MLSGTASSFENIPTKNALDSPKSEELWARRMCETGDYFEMLTRLKDSPFVFKSQQDRIVRQYGERLEQAKFLSPKDWEMITVLELYDPETFEHALRVFESIYEKAESRRNIGVFLRNRLRQENVRTEDLYRAALLHDIGKTSIPKEVLRDVTTDEDWMIYARMGLDPKTYESILTAFGKNPSLRAKDLVPVSCALPNNMIESLRDRGIDTSLPLGAIIGKHADISGDILRSYGYIVSAEIAESHHNRPLAEEIRPISLSSFRTSWILRAADIFDAICHVRTYKKEGSLDRALSILEEEAAIGFIDPKLTSLWIADELRMSR